MRFLASEWLWLLALVPLLVAAYLLLQRRRRSYAVRFTNLELLASVAPRRPGWRRHVAPAILLLTFAVLVGALARPAMPTLAPREQSSIMLVVDVSRSMSATDLMPDRITAAKDAARAFLNTIPARIRVGLVAFSDSAFLAAPLSRDRAQLGQAIDRLQPLAGTALGDGLALALAEIERQRLRTPNAPASVLLLSDGEANRGLPPQAVAQQAQAMKVPIYAVGVGTRGGMLIFRGRVLPAQLNEEQLRQIAESTGGSYFESGSAESLREVYRKLGSALGFERELREVTDVAAGLAALLLLIGAVSGLLWYHRIP